jgi:hypothetical protein
MIETPRGALGISLHQPLDEPDKLSFVAAATSRVTLAHVIAEGKRLVLEFCGCHKTKMIWPRLFDEQHEIDPKTRRLQSQRPMRATTIRTIGPTLRLQEFAAFSSS